MGKNSLRKSTLREIKHSLGRYIAMFAIIALGVGFFAGLKVTGTAMFDTAKKYYTDYNLFDFRLISTLGLTSEDVQVYNKLDYVQHAAGAHSLDVLIDGQMGEAAMRMHSLTEGINTPEIVYGELPTKENECVVDANHYDESIIGQTIVVSDGNKEETVDQLKIKEFVVTGVVKSPYYINFQRGNTSIGAGTIQSFLYVMEEAFVSDTYSEIYLTITDPKEAYSEEYLSQIEEITDKLEVVLQDQVNSKAKELKADIDEQYKNAKDSIRLAVIEEMKNQAFEQMDAITLASLEAAGITQDTITWEQLKEVTGIDDDVLESQVTKVLEDSDEIKDLRQYEELIASAKGYVLDRSTNTGYANFESDASIVDAIAKIFPIFFFAVAALVCLTTMTRMIEEQRTQIGILKALGYSNGSILGKYLTYSGSAAILGCIVGYILGTYLFPITIWQAYGIMYGFTNILYVFDLPLAILSLIVACICSMGATYVACRYELISVTAELIRPKAPTAGKRIMLEYIKPLWNRMSFLQKVSARNIFRYKKRFFMMILGIGGCTALLLTGFGLRDSILPVVSKQYEEIHKYDYSITLEEAYGTDKNNAFEVEAKDLLHDYMYASSENMSVVKKGQSMSIYLVVPQQEERMKDFIHLTLENETIPYPAIGEIVISTKVAKKLDVNVGDIVNLRNSNMETTEVTVSGICENYIYNYGYVNNETYKDGFGKAPTYKSIFVNAEEGTDVNQETAQILGMDNVVSVLVNDTMKESFENTMSSLNYVVLLVIFCAGALAFIVLYNLTNININERIREIATIKVLGFYPLEMASYVYRENLVLTLFGAVIGLLLGRYLHSFVMNSIDIEVVTFAININSLSYLYAILLTFGFAFIVNVTMYFKLQKINMTEALKSIE